MNKEDYVSYPMALALKKAGFDWKCDHCYAKTSDSEHEFIGMTTSRDYNKPRAGEPSFLSPICSAVPLWQAQKWLREVKRIEVNASWESIKRYWFFYTNLMDVPDIVNLEDISDSVYSTYEQALSAGIAAALELIEKKGE